MRLLNTSTLELCEYMGYNIPSYAILSHRWESEEVSFQDFKSEKREKMAGYAKIKSCCAKAAADGWKYVWIDSCCIDKSSSAELSEAINSMFKWYKDAEVCYAYLNDVLVKGDYDAIVHSFRRSKWFTRGWTLQELLAPLLVIFCDQNWVEIGTKSSLEDELTSITGIDDFIHYETACVAQKMSWAAQRQTTRVEDIAYCLLGLFGVHMPPLYGEGTQAFRRLQLEIMKESNDESIFAWAHNEVSRIGTGLLASSPSAFKDSKDFRLVPTPDSEGEDVEPFDRARPPFSMTNKGLSIKLFRVPTFKIFENQVVVNSRGQVLPAKNIPFLKTTFVALLDGVRHVKTDQRLGVVLSDLTNEKQCERMIGQHLLLLSPLKEVYSLKGSCTVIEEELFVQKLADYDEKPLVPTDKFLIDKGKLNKHNFSISNLFVLNPDRRIWQERNPEVYEVSLYHYALCVGFEVTEPQFDQRFVIMVGPRSNRHFGVTILTPKADVSFAQVQEAFLLLEGGCFAYIFRFDRVSIPLVGGTSLQVSLRNKQWWGRARRSLVDIIIDPQIFPWPNPGLDEEQVARLLPKELEHMKRVISLLKR